MGRGKQVQGLDDPLAFPHQTPGVGLPVTQLGWLGWHSRPQTREVGAGLQAQGRSMWECGGACQVLRVLQTPTPLCTTHQAFSGPHTTGAGGDVNAPSSAGAMGPGSWLSCVTGAGSTKCHQVSPAGYSAGPCLPRCPPRGTSGTFWTPEAD